jgi:hypothetical protein
MISHRTRTENENLRESGRSGREGTLEISDIIYHHIFY